jgi:hypothetical protein
MDIQKTIGDYLYLRGAVCKAIRDGKANFYEGGWFNAAIIEPDIQLGNIISQGLEFYGHSFTSQTQDNEYFDGTVALSDLGVEV